MGDVCGGKVAHGFAAVKQISFVVFHQVFGEAGDVMTWREIIAAHDAEQGLEAGAFDACTAGHLRAFFFDVLRDGAAIKFFES